MKLKKGLDNAYCHITYGILNAACIQIFNFLTHSQLIDFKYQKYISITPTENFGNNHLGNNTNQCRVQFGRGDAMNNVATV